MSTEGLTRFTRTGSFMLPCPPHEALPLFTPEGERAWVPGWSPSYCSEAVDETGAVWTTDIHGVATTWVTVVRDEDHVRYARLSGNGTAGIVDVRCGPDADGSLVRVGYDLTATSEAGRAALADFAAHYEEMLATWRDLITLRLLLLEESRGASAQ